MKKGKLIVIEGTDGSGKATQSKLLIKRLKKTGHKVKFLDFPQYGKPSCGAVEKYLNGKYGSAKAVGPYRASIFYAVDRYDASFKTSEWLKKGYIVIANRYVASNLAHQGGKIQNSQARRHYFRWIEQLEFETFGIPRPDLNIILYVPAKISQRMVKLKGIRKYLGKKTHDIHEADLQHLKQAEKAYIELTSLFPDKFQIINCVENGVVMDRQEISSLLWRKVSKVI